MALTVGDIQARLSLDDSAFKSGLANAEKSAESFGSKLGSILKTGVVAGGAAVAAAATVGTKAYLDYESGLADVAKTTGLAGEALDELGDGLRKMSTETGNSITNLESIASIAGQLGISGSSNILDFTKTVNQASVAFGMAPEAAANAMAKLGNIWGIPTNELYKMGSAVNYLGNTTAASESQLFDFMMNLGNQARLIGMSSQESLLFGDILVSMGMNASDAGTRLNSAFGSAGLIGNLDTAARYLGVTEDKMRAMMDSAPTETVLQLVDALGKIPSTTDQLAATQEIFGTIGAKAIMPLIGRTDQYRASLGEVNKAYNEGTAMADEFNTRMGTLGNQLSRIKAGLNDVGISIGEALAPALAGVADWMNTTGIPALKEFVEAASSGDWSKVGDMISKGVKTGWNKIKDLGKDLYNSIRNINWSGLGSWIAGGIKGAWAELSALGGQLLGWLSSIDWSAVGLNILNTLGGIGDSILDSLGGAFNSIASYDWGAAFGSAINEINQLLSGIDFSAIGQKLSEYIQNVGSAMGNIAQGLYDALSSIDWAGALSSLQGALTGAASWLWDALSGVDWSGVGQTIGSALRSGLETLKDIGSKIADWIKGGISPSDGRSIGETIKSGLATVAGWATDIANGIKNGIGWDGDVGRFIADKIKAGIGAVKDFYYWIKQSLTDWVQGGGPGEIGKALGELLAAGIEMAKNSLLDKGKAILDWLMDGFAPDGKVDLWGGIKWIIGEAADWVSLGASAVASFVSGFLEGTGLSRLAWEIKSSILTAVASALEAVPGIGQGAADKVRSWIGEAPAMPTSSGTGSKTTTITGSKTTTINGKKYEVGPDGKLYEVSGGGGGGGSTTGTSRATTAASTTGAASGTGGAVAGGTYLPYSLYAAQSDVTRWADIAKAIDYASGGEFKTRRPGGKWSGTQDVETAIQKLAAMGYHFDEITEGLQAAWEESGHSTDLFQAMGLSASDVSSALNKGAAEWRNANKDSLNYQISGAKQAAQTTTTAATQAASIAGISAMGWSQAIGYFDMEQTKARASVIDQNMQSNILSWYTTGQAVNTMTLEGARNVQTSGQFAGMQMTSGANAVNSSSVLLSGILDMQSANWGAAGIQVSSGLTSGANALNNAAVSVNNAAANMVMAGQAGGQAVYSGCSGGADWLCDGCAEGAQTLVAGAGDSVSLWGYPGSCLGNSMAGFNPLVYTSPTGEVTLWNPVTKQPWNPSMGIGGSVVTSLGSTPPSSSQSSYSSSQSSYGSSQWSGYQPSTQSSAYTTSSPINTSVLAPSQWTGMKYASGGIARTPQLAKIAESGPEIVLPSNVTAAVLAGVRGGNKGEPIVVNVYLGGKKIASEVMNTAVGGMRTAGAMKVR